MSKQTDAYFATLGALPGTVRCHDSGGAELSLDEAIGGFVTLAQKTHEASNKLIFIGNGGSAGIASHMAIDYSKNGNIRAQAFNDSSALTCLGNDLGYENVFSKQIELHARPDDLLVAISSSGNSENILGGVTQARESGCRVITLSGFSEDNRLRGRGDINFYVPSQEYGFVEITHLALCHAVVDLAMGWQPQS
jgi:D-sedoheptulose 7-phosphate isomerase